ncbi:MAG: helix-turn-helix transcriptional regulator [Christensenella sp.]
MSQKLRQDISIGSTIQRLRNTSGLTQEQVVAQLEIMGCSMSRSAYSQIEIGTYNIRISELIALRQIFGADYADFFSDLP